MKKQEEYGVLEYPKVNRKLPYCFEDKIKLDAAMTTHLEYGRSGEVKTVTDWVLWGNKFKQIKSDLDLCRYSCEEFIKRQRSGTSGGPNFA